MSYIEITLWCLFWVVFIGISFLAWGFHLVALEIIADPDKAREKYGIKGGEWK